MINAFYSATSGAVSYQNKLNVTANNLANVGTTGFKAQRATFTDLLYTGIPSAENRLQMGNGVKIGDISPGISPGSIVETGRSLDLSIEGEGYFCVRDAAGNNYYTRAGAFQISTDTTEGYIVTSNGDFLLDETLLPISITDGADQTSFSTSSIGGTDNRIQPAVFEFDNPYALIFEGQGRLSATGASGEGRISYDSKIRRGTLEASNVDTASEMTGLLLSQRGFQFCARITQAVDEMEKTANSLRG